MDRIAVFLDYSNVHLVGHDLFARDFEKWTTHVSPRRVAESIMSKRTKEGELAGIFLFRGSPERFSDPEATKIFRDEQRRWAADPLIQATYLPLHYAKYRVQPKESGVDVRLSLDLVKTAESHRFDTLILFSGDSDCFPAVQDVVKTTTHLELAAWSDGRGYPGNRIAQQAAKHFRLWTHRLSEDDFWDCQDNQDFMAA
ncbi:NYN domain-containing protein [Arthrobacter sp. NPDC058192]|uniref:NYN domain-containing protein n=1 Tax=Arthrobacter sp. NPDC058192 TaxID=3346372 RepID=UPI0036E9AC55